MDQKGAGVIMHTERWYQARLAKYFVEHFEKYEDTANFYPDPSIKQWLFEIEELGLRVRLTCEETGHIIEERFEKGGVKL